MGPKRKSEGTSVSPIVVSPASSSQASSNISDNNVSNEATPSKRSKRKSAQIASLKNQLIYTNHQPPSANVPGTVSSHGNATINPAHNINGNDQILQNSPVIKDANGNESKPMSNAALSIDIEYAKDIRSMLDKSRINDGDTNNMKKSGEFSEPPLAPPKPSYSGLPLESFPSAKIKKESLWPKLKKMKNNVGETILIEVDDDNKETKYNSQLKTKESTQLTSDSKIRTITKPTKNPKLPRKRIPSSSASPSPSPSTPTKSKKGPKNKSDKPSKDKSSKDKIKKTTTTINGTKTPKLEHVNKSPLRSSKRIKVISPKKSITSSNLAPSLNRNESDVSQSDESTNDDFCSACGGSGIFICCETCPKSFHFICCDPPLDDLPEENWSCRECLSKKDANILKKWNHIGMFGQLINQTEVMNPFEFQLPKKLRDGTFLNVSTDNHGQYNDGTLKPELSYSKLNGSQIPGFNYNHNLEIDSIYDKSGKPYLCHNCGLSGLNNRVLVHCDYCPLTWHMDCLNEPCYKPKTLGSKWRCPNHIENLVPINLFSKRNLKDSSVIDVSLHNHFLKIIQNSNFLVKYRDQPFIKDDNNKFPSLQEYLNYEINDFKQKNPNYSKNIFNPDGVNTLDNNDDIHENYKVPDFFNNNYSIPNNIVAKPSNELKKIMTMTDESFNDPFNFNDDENFNENRVSSFIYRIPEESILLDFITKVKKPKNNSKKLQHKYNGEAKKSILQDIEYYEKEKQREIQTQEEFLDNVNYFKDSGGKEINDTSNFEKLVEVALQDNNKSPDELNNEEIMNIKKLMQIKGKDALLEFLKS